MPRVGRGCRVGAHRGERESGLHVNLPELSPAYDGAWNGALVPALLERRTPDWFPEPVPAGGSVVLLVLDGLGWGMVCEHGDVLPTLTAMRGTRITTSAPSTTAAALTSIATGLPPSVHGVVGYRMRVAGEILNILQWRTAAGEPGPDPRVVQPHEGFGGRKVPIITRAAFDGSGFTAAHLRTGRFLGWDTTAILHTHVLDAVRAGEPFIYAYYDGVDKIAHAFGLRDEQLHAELRSTDRIVEDLLAALPSDCTLVVTADHGHVHVGRRGMRDLDGVRGLVAAYSGEGRCRSLHAAPGAARRLLERARRLYEDEAWVLSRDELWESGLFGPNPNVEVRSRIGDVVLLARSDVAYVAPDALREAQLIGCHGSLTAEELQVPLLVARGTS